MVPVPSIETANHAHSMSSRLSRATWLRLGAVLLVSLLVHLSLIGVLPGLPNWHGPVDQPLMASIEPLPAKPESVVPAVQPSAQPAAALSAAAPAASPPVPKVHPERSPAIRSVPLPRTESAEPPAASPPVLQTASPSPDALALRQPSEGANASGSSTQGAAPSSIAVAAAPAAPPSILPLPPAPPAARPVDANLSYRVTALDPSKPNQTYAGEGTLIFHSDPAGYHASLEVNAQALFVSISVLTSVSDGAVGTDGLEPARYSESRRNRPTGVASFARAADGSTDLSSTQGKDVSKAPPGSQDRLTVLLQIGALMQANPAMKRAGASFAIPVAGERGGVDIWNFVVQGEEQVQTDSGTRAAWHVERVVRPGTNDRGLDIWVESATPHLPLRVLYTDPGDKTIDLVLASDPSHPAASTQ